MSKLKELETIIRTAGGFSGQLKLLISVVSEFEGFYGKASEDWEKQTIIEIIVPKDSKYKSIKIVGNRFDTIDNVAGKVLDELNKIL